MCVNSVLLAPRFRSALSFLDSKELVAGIGPGTVSAVIQCLFDLKKLLPASELAAQIGVAIQTLRTNDLFFADLELSNNYLRSVFDYAASLRSV